MMSKKVYPLQDEIQKDLIESAKFIFDEKINTDPRYGNSITINHGNGFKTVYSNLLTAEFVI